MAADPLQELITWLLTPYSSSASTASELGTQQAALQRCRLHPDSQRACSPGQTGGFPVPAAPAVLEPGQSWGFWGGPERLGSRWKPSAAGSPPAARTCAGRAAGTWPWAARRGRLPCTSWPGPAPAELSLKSASYQQDHVTKRMQMQIYAQAEHIVVQAGGSQKPDEAR